MSGRTWMTYGLLVTLAAAFAFLTRTTSETGGPDLPSVANMRGGGLAALRIYLDELGGKPRVIEEELFAVKWETLVIAAPTARMVTAEEIARIDKRVSEGATVIVLTPDEHGSQPRLFDWLQLRRTDRLKVVALEGGVDRGGATAQVWSASGPFSGLSSLRVGGNRGVASDDAAFLPVAGTDEATVLLWKQHGKGQIIVGAGADLAENRRIELLDNRKLWESVAARGTVSFDEFHHTHPPAPPMSVGIFAFVLQALFALAFLTAARGTRLGPLRPLVAIRHRAGLEYAESFAWLVRGAHVEKELAADVYERLRRIIHERLGISLSLPASDFGIELSRRMDFTSEAWLDLDARFRAAAASGSMTPAQFAELSREAARLELRVRGSR